MKNKAFFMNALQSMVPGVTAMPVPGDDDVLIRMKAVGICGSDLHYYQKGRIGNCVVEFPFILGHEAAGEIISVGKNVTHLKPGDRVCMEPGIPCGHCDQCLSGHYNLCKHVRFWATPPYPGCLCEYVVHPAAFTFKLPDNMSYTEGALVEPLAIGLHAANTAGVTLGKSVVILGAGCIGLVTLMAAKASGSTKIIVADVLDRRLEKAHELGATVINTAKEDLHLFVAEQTGGNGADIVIDCAGYSSTVAQAFDVAGRGATVVLVGLGQDYWDGVPSAPLSCKELTVKSIFRYRNLYPIAIQAVSSGLINIKSIVSHKFSFADSANAFETCTKDIEKVVKCVIEYE